MKILVCISHVPDTTSKINFKDNDTAFDSQGVQYIINPNDEFALSKALLIKEQHGGQVTVAHVGSSASEPTLRKALAIGADTAIRIDTAPTDAFVVAKQLTDVVKKEHFDLILAGRESIDYNGGMVPGLIAALLDYPFINNCIGLHISEQQVEAIRDIDGGKETLNTTLPVVVGAQKGLLEESELRIPNMRGIMMARKKPLTVIQPVAATARTTSIQFEKPAPKSAVKLIAPDDLDTLVKLLHSEAKVI